MTDESTGGGLHIDTDWKTEAAREKEILAAQEKQEKQKPAGTEKANFIELVNMIALQAGIALGGYQEPGGQKIPPNPHAAKHYVDLLEVIQTKTQGNLDDEEKKILNAVTHELRMLYVQTVSEPPPAMDPEKNV